MRESMLDEIAAFVHVVEAGSFTAAARRRTVPKSTLSRGVTRLEDALRTPLLVRTARRVTLTEAGQAFYDRVAPHVMSLRNAAEVAGERGDELRGTLRVTAPVDVGEALLGEVFVRFMARYPSLRLEVDLSAREVNLLEEGFDVALRAAQRLRDSSLIARKLGDMEFHLVAAPGYLARRGTPRTPEELARHECVLFRPLDGHQEWALTGGGAERRVTVAGRAGGSELAFVRGMLRAGAGIGLLPSFYVGADVAQGLLARVLPGWSTPGGSLFVVYPSARHIPRKVQLFRDFILESFAGDGRPAGLQRGPSA